MHYLCYTFGAGNINRCVTETYIALLTQFACCSWLHLIVLSYFDVFAVSLWGLQNETIFLPRWYDAMNQAQNHFSDRSERWGVLCVHASKFSMCAFITLPVIELPLFPGLPTSSFYCLQCAQMDCKLSKTGSGERRLGNEAKAELHIVL